MSALRITTSDRQLGLELIYDDLSNMEFSAVLHGGSAGVVMIDPSGNRFSGHVDADGVWLDDDGYISNFKGWTMDRHY